MQLRWSHAVLYVTELDEMIGFYRDVLGFEVSDRGDLVENGPSIVFLSQSPTDHHQIAFVSTGRGEGGSNSHNHMAFRVESLADVRTMAERLKTDGRASGVSAICHGNAWSVYFQDPEDNGLEVFCDTPWHVKQPQAKPWDLSWSDEELSKWTQETFGGEPEFGSIDAYYARRT